VPKIKIEVLNLVTSKTNTCAANIKVIVGDEDGTVLREAGGSPQGLQGLMWGRIYRTLKGKQNSSLHS
jgi:hypothetical protein